MTTNDLHNKYFLMNSRYERAGTLGFRCAADVPGTDKPMKCKGKTVCGTFDAPNAAVKLPATGADWVVWDGATTVRSVGKSRISAATAGVPGAALTPCNRTGTCSGLHSQFQLPRAVEIHHVAAVRFLIL
jgi:hypothetical protein